MNFDQMMDAWRAQDDKPLYGLNRDLLQLVLQNEQDKVRRKMRRDQWMVYVCGAGMALFAGFWLWVLIVVRGPVLQTVAAAMGTLLFVLWVVAFWVSHRRRTQRERGFGNSLSDEIGRSLTLIEYQIANGSWGIGVLWVAPAMIGATLLYWLTFQINTDTSFSAWHHLFIMGAMVWSAVYVPYAASREVAQKLEPRRQHLRALLKSLEAGE